MKDLSKARDEIDNIDTQIIKLFEQRMDIVKDVANYKIENNLPVLDSSRENMMLEKNLKKITNEEYKKYYESMDPATAEYIYKQVVTQLQESKEVQDYAAAYSSMKPKQAAAIFEKMTNNLDLAEFKRKYGCCRPGEDFRCDGSGRCRPAY